MSGRVFDVVRVWLWVGAFSVVGWAADFDLDGDVDGNDFLTFSVCYNGALNSPRPNCVNLEADMDGDGDVDAVDYQLMQRCAGVVYASYNHATDPGLRCGCADLNGDGYVDETDVALFYYVITGPQ